MLPASTIRMSHIEGSEFNSFNVQKNFQILKREFVSILL